MNDWETYLEIAVTWATTRKDVNAIALVGSHARVNARADSDLDLILITTAPSRYLNDTEWLSAFGQVRTVNREDWGLLQALRTKYSDGREVEFGICSEEWAKTDPIDAGTRQVVIDGMKILFDPDGVLTELEAAIRRG
jgi:uncharacterized protein